MHDHKYAYVFEQIPVENIQRDPDQPRRDFGTEGETNRLLVSIRQYGIENVIAVSELESGRYIIIDGHRRYMCAQKLGFTHVPCRLYPKLGVAELEAIRYEMQNNRRPWKPSERSEALERIKTASGFTSNKQLAQHLGIAESVVANSLQLRKVKADYQELMIKFDLSESYRIEFVRLKPKLRKIRGYEVDEIIFNLFERINNKVIKNSKEFRKLGSIFLRATANEEELARYLDDPDMTIYELEQRTLQSGFSLIIEQLINSVTNKRSNGIAFSAQEVSFLDQLKDLLNQAI